MSMVARDHECSACGGTSAVKAVDARGYYAAPYGGPSGAWFAGLDRCPACLGSGRCSDVRTVADAMVDAETLRAIARETGTETVSRALTAIAWQTINGSKRGRYYRARLAAHAAFLAVPALRGEEE